MKTNTQAAYIRISQLDRPINREVVESCIRKWIAPALARSIHDGWGDAGRGVEEVPIEESARVDPPDLAFPQ